MLINTREFRKRDLAYISDRFPGFARIEPSVYLQKDGGLLRLFDVSMRDPLGLDDNAIDLIYETGNSELTRFGPGWAFWFERARWRSPVPERPQWPNAAAEAFDDERMAPYHAGERFDTKFHIGVFWLPPSAMEGKADKALVQEGDNQWENDQFRHLDEFLRETSSFASSIRRVVDRISPCTDRSGDTYLHSCVSHHNHEVELADPVFIDGQLCDCDHSGSMRPTLGDVHLRTIGLRGFPQGTAERVLDELSIVPIEHRYVVRWISLGPDESKRRIEKVLNMYLFHKLGIKSLAIAIITKEEAKTVKKDSIHAAEDADTALEESVRSGIVYGHVTATFLLWDADRRKAEAASQVVQGIFRNAGFTAKEETLMAQEAFLGAIPGHPYANIARPMLPSRTCAHMAPITGVWCGNEKTQPILMARTPGRDPFRVSLRAYGVEHAILLGQSGNGKSVLLSSLALGAQRDPDRKIVIIERGKSAMVMTLCCGGTHIDIGSGRQSFQPLADIDDTDGFNAGLVWVEATIHDRGVAVDQGVKRHIRTALELLRSRPVRERTLTLFHAFMPPSDAKDSLVPFIGSMLDGDHGPDLSAAVVTLEMSELMDGENKPFLVPTLMHVFRMIGKMIRATKGFLIVDEAWRFVAENSVAGPQLLEGLKEARKYDWGIILATQELGDFSRSALADAIMSNCKTRLFTADKAAEQKTQAEQYDAININAQTRKLLREAVPMDEYIISQEGNIGVFSLDLGPRGIAIVGSNSDTDRAAVDYILRNYGRENFFAHWMAFKGLGPTPAETGRLRYAAE